MVSPENGRRIAGDAYIVMDCMESIIDSQDHLSEDYLREKVETAQRCLDFMKHFYKEEK